jgi:hypothetical protein
MFAERMLLANAGSQAAHVAQGHQVVGSGAVIVLLQNPTIEVKITVPMTVNAFDFVTVHNANSTACSHFQLLLLQYVHIIAFWLFLVNLESSTAKVLLFVTHQIRT